MSAAATQKPVGFWEFVFAIGLVFADITSMMLTAIYAAIVVPVMQYSLALRTAPLDWTEIAELIARTYLTTAFYGLLCGTIFAAVAVYTRRKDAWIAVTVSLAVLLFAHLAPFMNLQPFWQWRFTTLLGVICFILLTTFASWDTINRRFFGAT